MAKKKQLRPNKLKTQATALPLKAITQKQTKVQILKNISEETGLPLKQVKAVFETASHLAI